MNLIDPEIIHKIYKDPKYIAIKRFSNNIDLLLERYPEGCSSRIIAQALLITEEEVESIYQQIIEKLRKRLT
jgi:hypothetical protein